MGKMLANFRAEYGIGEFDKVTYSGRLDPLASGEVLVLTGDDIYKKDDFNKHDKVYKFAILFGVATDTGDVLGILQKSDIVKKVFNSNLNKLDNKTILNTVHKFRKTYKQKYPAYSSYNIKGTPMWQLAKEGNLHKKISNNFFARLFSKKIRPPTNKVTIYNLDVLNIYTKAGEEIMSEVRAKIDSVDGDFRQAVTVNGWGDFFQKNKEKKFIMADIRATVSSGTYIRTLCGDIGKKLNIPALAYRIEREEVL